MRLAPSRLVFALAVAGAHPARLASGLTAGAVHRCTAQTLGDVPAQTRMACMPPPDDATARIQP
jgi:hypothetical protein